ncbi:MAG: irtA [Massilibacillus sp.]|nr:irtA [Massilibacillus sp.]
MSGFIKICSYAKEHRRKTYLAIFLIFLSALSGIVPYLFTYDLMIRFIELNTVTLNYLLLISAGIFISLLLQSFLFYKGLTASHQAAYDTLMELRIKFAEKMSKLPMGDIKARGVGSYKKNFVDDIESTETLLAHMIPEGIPFVIAPIIVYIVLFSLDWRLGFLSLASVFVGMIPIFIMMRSSLKKMGHYYDSARKMNATIVEYVSGMEVIKIFNRTSSSYENYVMSIENYKKYTLDWFKESWTYMAIYSSILPCTILFLLPVGTIFYINGTLTFPVLAFSLLLSMGLGQPLLRLVDFMPTIPVLKHKIEQLEKTFSGQELITLNKNINPTHYDVDFRNVYFGYEEQNVIRNISFTAKENNVTAIVGASGSGKSTLAKLLVHFWDVKAGEITIGGVTIQDFSFEELMNIVSYVSQDIFLFNTTVMENIRIGRPDATDEEVIACAKAAMCHDFITELDRGYETIAGEDGNKFSGGEKQRISIARAILKNAPIIVLDEATAFTDPENEDKIQAALNKLIIGKTVIVIAHRLSTIADANKIIVLDKGALISEGIHSQLLKSSDVYQHLWNSHMETLHWGIKVKGGSACLRSSIGF